MKERQLKWTFCRRCMCDRAWREVTEKTIVNCFKKARFVRNDENGKHPVDPDDAFSENEENNKQLNEDFQSLAKTLHIEESGTLIKDFVEVDGNVAVTGELSDEDIVEEVKVVAEEEDENEEYSPPPKVTCREAKLLIQKLRNFVESRPNRTPETFHALAQLENVIDIERSSTCNQTVIDDYFEK